MKELTFRDYLRILRKRKWWIIAFVVAMPIIGFLSTKRQVPIYEAEAIIKTSSQSPIVTVTQSEVTWWDASTTVETEMELMKSTKVVERAARKLGSIKGNLSELEVARIVKSLRNKIKLEQVEKTDFVTIKVRDSNPYFAAEFANGLVASYKDEHILEKTNEARTMKTFLGQQLTEREIALKNSEDSLKKYKEENAEFFLLAETYRNRLTDLNEKISKLTEVYTPNYWKVKMLNGEVAKIQQSLKDLPRKELELERLEREAESNKALYITTRDKLNDSRTVEQGTVQDVVFVTAAIPPTSPVNPSQKTNLIITLIAGLLLGFIFAFVSESLDTSIATIDEIENYLNMPVLGIIPTIRQNEQQSQFSLLTRVASDRSFLEPWHTLCANIVFAIGGKGGKTFLITSTIPGEGKTTTALNMAMTMAHMGKKTLLIDVDIKKASIHKMFSMSREPGFTDLILDNTRQDEAIMGVPHFIVTGLLKENELAKISGIDNLYVMSAGHSSPNPMQLMDSPEAKELMDKLKSEFDIIIFDATPVLTTAVTSIIASKVDWVIMIYEVGKVARGSLRRAITQVIHTKAKVLGIVLNKMKTEDLEPGTDYYYHYRYYPEIQEKKGIGKVFKKSTYKSPTSLKADLVKKSLDEK